MRYDEITNENLKKWFKEKWVRFGPDGKIRGDCARGSNTEGKPKCLPQSKAHALGKKGRASAAAKKRREDPNAERQGPAKNVATKVKEAQTDYQKRRQRERDVDMGKPVKPLPKNPKTDYQKKREQERRELELGETNTLENVKAMLADFKKLNELKCWSGYHRVKGTKAGFPGSCAKNESMTEEHELCPECGGNMYPETMINEKQDACYYKVKSRYKVWPSAYASGALVQCRKKGAKNWGSKSKNEGHYMKIDQIIAEAANPAQQAAIAISKKKNNTQTKSVQEEWSEKYKRSIDCSNPKGFSQKAHCAGKKKNEDIDHAEYNDEAGMFKNDLQTIQRVSTHLEKAIYDNENLPEWCQAKISQAKGMIVSVMDYLISQHENGMIDTMNEEFDLIENVINNLAIRNEVDAEVIWEDLESLTDDELYVFAVTQPVMEDWQKANRKDKTAGMSQKAVNAYRREHPGSKLKTAVTTKPSKLKKGSKASKRRKSYCSRSRGQMKMHNISCQKTPDKAICKARRRWNCE